MSAAIPGRKPGVERGHLTGAIARTTLGPGTCSAWLTCRHRTDRLLAIPARHCPRCRSRTGWRLEPSLEAAIATRRRLKEHEPSGDGAVTATRPEILPQGGAVVSDG
jgi:hypothetical protein